MAQAACADASEEVSEDLVKHLVRLLHMPGAE